MNVRKTIRLILVAALCVLTITGCGSKAPEGTEARSIESTSPIPPPISGNLLESIVLELPDEITRENISDTRAIFCADGEIIGGIEILDIAGQRETLPFTDDYMNLASEVTKLVRDGGFDYTVEKATGMSDVEVKIIFWDNGQCFVHYFFFGETVVYDIWEGSDILDGQDMIHILKTLHSPDIVNPQDENPVNQDVPILNLRIDLPEGILRMPASKTRLLFYNIPSLEEYVTNENVVGGVEAVTDASDLEALESSLSALGQRYLGGEYKTASQKSSGDALAKITASSPEDDLICYIVQVEEDVYAVWASTTIIAEDDILKIAKSCCY